jgi:signal transduction histidine kinase
VISPAVAARRMRARAGSLEARLVAISALWIAVALGAAAFVLADLYREHVAQEHAERVRGSLEELAGTLDVDATGRLVSTRPLADPAFRRPYSGYYWDVSAGGRVLLRSRSLWDHALPASGRGASGGEPQRLAGPDGGSLLAWTQTVRLPRHPEPLTLRVAADDSRVAAMAASFAKTLAVSLALLAVGLFALVVVQVRIGLAPLRRLGAAVTALRAGQSDDVDGEFPSEVRPLVDDLNAVLRQNRDLLARARTHAGNLAHALKTPLAVMRNALPDVGPPAAAATLREQVERMHAAIERHLVRARAGAATVPGRHAAVAPAIDDVLRVLRRAGGARIEFEAVVAPGLRFAGDAADLQEILGNLLDNAGKWARTRVRVTARREADGLRIDVEDDGPGIPPEQRSDAIRRGVRLDTTRPGTGLGLQIVDELCGIYGGSLALGDAALGGLAATVRLPAG